MKTTIKIVFWVCVIGLIPNLNADNLIKNGSLDDKAGWGLPAGGSWQKEGDNQFFRLEQQEPGKMLMIYKEFAIPEGTKALRFSVDARTKNVVKGDKPWFGARVLAKLMDKDNKKLASPLLVFGNKDGWQTKSVKFDVPEGAVKFVMMPTLFRVKSGAIDFDNFVLEPVAPKVKKPEIVFETPNSVIITPNAENIQYVGRFSKNFCFGWSGSTVRVKFNGTELLAKIKLTKGLKGGLQIVIDGKPNDKKLYITKDQNIYRIVSGLKPGEHIVELVKTDEGYVSEMCLEGFSLSKGGRFLPLVKKERQILVLGDSITCGYANETLDRNTGNNVTNQNAYLTYGQVAGRELNADVTMICWSGFGIFRNRNMSNDKENIIPKVFNRTLPLEKSDIYNFSLAKPDVIAINLGTNDKHTGGKKAALKKDDYIGAYTKFISKLGKIYPNAKIIVSIGPMYRGKDVISWLKEIADSNPKVYFLLYGKMNDPEDIAGHWHPSVKMHKKMGKTLKNKIVEITGWK